MAANPSEKCRLCQCSFKIKFGMTAERPGKDGHRSPENLFVPSIREECFGTVLAAAYKEVGIEVVNNPAKYSSRVCNKCARKIRNLSELYRDVKTLLESTSTSKDSQPKKYFSPTKSKENNQRKHSLNTPHGSSPSCKTLRTKSPNKPACKSPIIENVLVENRLDNCLNIEDLTNEGLQLKVVFVSNGTRSVTTRIRREKRIKYLIRQLYKNL